MAHIGNKLAPRFLCSLNTGHIVQNSERPATGQRCSIDFEHAPRSERTRTARTDFAPIECATDASKQLGIAHGVDQRTSRMRRGQEVPPPWTNGRRESSYPSKRRSS